MILSPKEQAKLYVKKGYSPLIVKYKDKKPIVNNWQRVKVDENNFEKIFSKSNLYNVGLLLGEPSGYLIDIDLDNPIAVAFAKKYLPKTKMIFGRKSNPNSHYLYICQITKTFKFGSKKHGMILEIRSNGSQTVAPPSIHKTGELIEFTYPDFEPSKVEEDILIWSCRKIVVAVLLIINYPKKGGRNDFWLVLSGILLKSGMSVDEAYDFIFDVADYCEDEEAQARGKIVYSTHDKIEADELVKGIPSLEDFMEKSDINDLCKFLNISKKDIPKEEILSEVKAVINEFNSQYTYAIVGGKGVIIREIIDENGNKSYDFISSDSFRNLYANRKIIVGFHSDGSPKYKTAFEVWFYSADRNSAKGIEFAPLEPRSGYYNLFKGFPVIAGNKGGCDLLLRHILDNICSGNNEYYTWLISWFADIIQNPTKKPGTAVTIIGKQGCGKSIFVEMFGRLLGNYYVIANHPRFVTGNFNAHLLTCLLLHAEEAFWAGDKTCESKLKDMITGTSQLIEFKGKDPVKAKNYTRLITTTNARWASPSGLEERRFFVLEASDNKIQDHGYFSKISNQMEKASGYNALMDHLLNLDISGVNLRQIPKTETLLEQKLLSLEPKMKWWLDMLMRGTLPKTIGWNKCSTEIFCQDYFDHAKKIIGNPRSAMTEVGSFINRVVIGLGKRVDSHDVHEDPLDTAFTYKFHGKCYIFPPLNECRQQFEAQIGQKMNWEV